jgi:hypothetical protein
MRLLSAQHKDVATIIVVMYATLHCLGAMERIIAHVARGSNSQYYMGPSFIEGPMLIVCWQRKINRVSGRS